MPSEELPGRIEDVLTRLKNAEKEIAQLKTQQVLGSAGSLLDKAQDVNGVTVVAEVVPDVDGNGLRALASDIRGRLGSRPGVVALFSPAGEKLSFVVATTKAAQEQGHRRGQARAVVRRKDRRPRRRQARHGPGRWHEPGRCGRGGHGPALGDRRHWLTAETAARIGLARTIRAAAVGSEWMSDPSGSGWR